MSPSWRVPLGNTCLAFAGGSSVPTAPRLADSVLGIVASVAVVLGTMVAVGGGAFGVMSVGSCTGITTFAVDAAILSVMACCCTDMAFGFLPFVLN